MTVTEQINAELALVNYERLTSENNRMGVGEHIAKLSGFLPRVNAEVAKRQSMYNLCLNEHLTGEHKTVSHAKIAAEASPEYAELLQAKMLREGIIEAIRGLKYLAKSMSDEYDYTK